MVMCEYSYICCTCVTSFRFYIVHVSHRDLYLLLPPQDQESLIRVLEDPLVLVNPLEELLLLQNRVEIVDNLLLFLLREDCDVALGQRTGDHDVAGALQDVVPHVLFRRLEVGLVPRRREGGTPFPQTELRRSAFVLLVTVAELCHPLCAVSGETGSDGGR